MDGRFRPKELIADASGAQFKNFTPEQGGRDRFGNHLFVSKDLAYIDGVQDLVRAGILISTDGDKFIKANPGILRDLDKALSMLEGTEGKNEPDEFVVLKSKGALQVMKNGRQSNAYLLTLGQEKFVIKTHTPSTPGWPKINQPYTNEMLQAQSLAVDLKYELASVGIRMSHFLFASGQVSCTRYEENTGDYNKLTEDRLTRLKSIVLKYLSTFPADSQLWENIKFDLVLRDHEGNFVAPFRNFRMKEDGTAVWVDPFVYYSNTYNY